MVAIPENDISCFVIFITSFSGMRTIFHGNRICGDGSLLLLRTPNSMATKSSFAYKHTQKGYNNNTTAMRIHAANCSNLDVA